MSVILPSLTNAMVLSVFEYLVDAELRKRSPNSMDFRFGCQEGAIMILSIMFGSADDKTAEQAYDSGETWLHLSERIVDEKLEIWAEAIDQLNADPTLTIDFERMHTAVRGAVQDFALANPDLLMDALKRNL